MTNSSADIERCDREIELCIANQSNPNERDKAGALMGELDWGWERDRLEKEERTRETE